MKQQFILTRKGQFTTTSKSNNQCKEPGYHDYYYEIRVKCGAKLDNQGFVIDTRLLEEIVLEAVRKMDSCERLCLLTAQALYLNLVEHGAIVNKIYVRIQPAIVDAKGFIEYEEEYGDEILDRRTRGHQVNRGEGQRVSR